MGNYFRSTVGGTVQVLVKDQAKHIVNFIIDKGTDFMAVEGLELDTLPPSTRNTANHIVSLDTIW